MCGNINQRSNVNWKLKSLLFQSSMYDEAPERQFKSWFNLHRYCHLQPASVDVDIWIRMYYASIKRAKDSLTSASVLFYCNVWAFVFNIVNSTQTTKYVPFEMLKLYW